MSTAIGFRGALFSRSLGISFILGSAKEKKEASAKKKVFL
ncbi:MAG: hypothetical protein JWO58_1928 [Chitinophagaceae bacterium]|nr:hypothetical protein [Chitinophagaceae bacterium]